MKISTGQIFDRAVTQMSTQQTKVAEMQAKLASGKQILQTSDDPDKAGLIHCVVLAVVVLAIQRDIAVFALHARA